MTVDLKSLEKAPRILFEVPLKPLAGSRIQPTGFPDLGAATYSAPDGQGGTIPTLLVESAQSMANRLEAVCWDEPADAVVSELKGLPYVKVTLAGLPGDHNTTSSLLEFHRLNSPYIMSGVTQDGAAFATLLKSELGLGSVAAALKKGGKNKTETTSEDSAGDKESDEGAGVVNLRKLAAVCFKYDPNSLIHGIFLEKIAGRLRHPRALSAFIEATGVERADSGGVKFDRVLPKPSIAGVDAKGGYGNVPFHRTEFTARDIKAYFSIDLAQIRGYGLGAEAEQLLTALSLWKVRKFLDSNMRLRTACELEVIDSTSIKGKRPDGFLLPDADDLAESIGKLIQKNRSHFAEPVVTELTWTNSKG
jgi:CRISPR-associated protein Csb1